MGESAFFKDEAKKRAMGAVKAAEAQTSAEFVIAVRKRSGDYRASDYHFGFLGFSLMFAYMMITPREFTIGAMALDSVLAFVLFTLLSANVSAVRRLLVRKSKRAENVLRAGRATFYELGISRTSGRNGVLVFVSAFERACEIVPDVNIDPKNADFAAACEAVKTAARGMDLEAFLKGVEALGAALGKTMPRQADDVNELPDEVQ